MLVSQGAMANPAGDPWLGPYRITWVLGLSFTRCSVSQEHGDRNIYISMT